MISISAPKAINWWFNQLRPIMTETNPIRIGCDTEQNLPNLPINSDIAVISIVEEEL